jgi:hypothetical protein
MRIRDYDGDVERSLAPIAVTVNESFTISDGGTLRMLLEADAWDSTISFASGIPVTRGGTLELLFADGVNLTAQIGRSFDLFNWAGVDPTGAFTVTSQFQWDLSNLYTTGEVTLTALSSLPGDFNGDGSVDAADYVVWRKTDGTQDGFDAWRTNFGRTNGAGAGSAGYRLGASAEPSSAAVPEPTAMLLTLAALGALISASRGGRTTFASESPT